jgi:hypothetical protein
MSDHDELPDFSQSGDPREEALWQAYQDMLRRRKEPRARWSAPDAPSFDPPPAAAAPPRPERARAAEPPVDTPPPPPLPARAPRAGAGRPGAWRRAALSAALVLAGGAALAIALWPRAPAVPGGAERARTPLAVAPPIPAPPRIAAPAPAPPPPPLSAEAAPKPEVLPGASASTAADRSAGPPPFSAERPRSSRAAEPRLARAGPKPALRHGHGARAARGPAGEVAAKRSATVAVRDFYNALAQGDGARAAAVVVPEKRQEGPLSAAELTRSYSSLRSPVRITKIDPIDDDKVFIRYHFVSAANHLCLASAIVDTTRRDGGALVSAIHVFHGC